MQYKQVYDEWCSKHYQPPCIEGSDILKNINRELMYCQKVVDNPLYKQIMCYKTFVRLDSDEDGNVNRHKAQI